MVFHSDQRPARLTLAEGYARSQLIARAWADVGLRRGDVIAVQLPNWAELAIAYYAAVSLGLVIVPIVHIYGPAEMGFIIRQSGARMLIVPDAWRGINYEQRLAQMGPAPDLEHVVVVGDTTHSGGTLWAALEERDPSDVRSLPELDVTADDFCAMVYTSGTTSEPKGVKHSHNTLLSELRASDTFMGTGRDHVLLSPYPAGHIGGLLGLIGPFINGRKCVFMDTWNADEAARLIEEHHVTVSSGTPFILMSLLDVFDTGRYDMSTLKRYPTGGAGVPPTVIERALAAGWFAYRSYGSSEHPTVTAAFPGDRPERCAHTDGRLTPGNSVSIRDDQGRELGLEQDGEIWTIGPEQFIGYQDPGLDVDSFDESGWFNTGDVGRMDGTGYLTVTDRKKDVIIRGGENISSKEVEDILSRHTSVAEVAVAAMPDPRYGERTCAFVILKPHCDLTLDDVRRHFQEAGVAKQKTPEHLNIVDDLPRTAAGKVKKFELRARLQSQVIE